MKLLSLELQGAGLWIYFFNKWLVNIYHLIGASPKKKVIPMNLQLIHVNSIGSILGRESI